MDINSTSLQPNNPKDALLAAAQLIETVGYHRLKDVDWRIQCFCVVTALVHVTPSNIPVRNAALHHIFDDLFPGNDDYTFNLSGGVMVGNWNDEQFHTSTVVDVMRKVANAIQ